MNLVALKTEIESDPTLAAHFARGAYTPIVSALAARHPVVLDSLASEVASAAIYPAEYAGLKESDRSLLALALASPRVLLVHSAFRAFTDGGATRAALTAAAARAATEDEMLWALVALRNAQPGSATPEGRLDLALQGIYATQAFKDAQDVVRTAHSAKDQTAYASAILARDALTKKARDDYDAERPR